MKPHSHLAHRPVCAFRYMTWTDALPSRVKTNMPSQSALGTFPSAPGSSNESNLHAPIRLSGLSVLRPGSSDADRAAPPAPNSTTINKSNDFISVLRTCTFGIRAHLVCMECFGPDWIYCAALDIRRLHVL